jgi:4-hydroxyphenylpyruvate dioxygenase
VVKNGNILFAFSSPYNCESDFSKEHGQHLIKHGDGVKSIAFTVENAELTYKVAVSRGAKSVQEPTKLEDTYGYVVIASVQTYGDTIHTFVERSNYKGVFLPGFIELKEDPINIRLGQAKYSHIDHIVGNHSLGDMEPTVQWYEKMLDFHRFWSIDDSIIHTEYR